MRCRSEYIRNFAMLVVEKESRQGRDKSPMFPSRNTESVGRSGFVDVLSFLVSFAWVLTSNAFWL